MNFFWFKKITLIALIAVTAIAFSSPVQAQGNKEKAKKNQNTLATTWYVATVGNDSADCRSASTPCLTINAAVNKAESGDIIKVAVGTYTTDSGYQVVRIGKGITLSGGWDAEFIIQNTLSVIDGQTTHTGILVYDSLYEVVIDHFKIQNGFNDFTGGGIYNNSVLTLNNSIVTNNTSNNIGGGIFNLGTLTINNSTIGNNIAAALGGTGGGGGGGIENMGGTLTLNNSTVYGNTLKGDFTGSGISSSGTVELNNSTISGNLGGDGSGISLFGSTVSINNSTISKNQYYGLISQASQVLLQNTIIAGNGAGGDCYKDPIYNGTITSRGYNLIGNGTNCAITPIIGDLIGTKTNPIDPVLGPLQDNGGPTFTHALMGNSPAINAGNPAEPGSIGIACLVDDQRGVTRPEGDLCDIGAYEVDIPVVSIKRQDANPNVSSIVHFTVTFSESVTGVDTLAPFNDFTLFTPGLTGTAITNVSGSGKTYTVTVNTGVGNGAIRLDVVDDDSIQDESLNPLGGSGIGNGSFSLGEVYNILKTITFSDVASNYWSWQHIERLYNAGITGGCSTNPLMYCPETFVNRAQMAIFILRSKHGNTFVPPPASGNKFGDVPADYWAAAWIEQLAKEGITGGCGNGNYCPEIIVTRGQMSVFLLRGLYSDTYSPPTAIGTMFDDVPSDYWAASWIEQLALKGITGGCGEAKYCPNLPVTRAQMAVFLVKAFNLP